MAMIPCTTGTVALYRRDDQTLLAVAVEAWDEGGLPYIAGKAKLIAADAEPGFVRLEQAAAELADPARPVKQPRRGERPPGQPEHPREKNRERR